MTDRRNNGRTTDGRFAPGNPGRPRGSRHRATIAAQSLLDGQSERLTQAAVDAALGGDVAALRLCLERLLPPRRDAPIRITLPPMETAADAAKAAAAVLAEVASGNMTPTEGAHLMALIDAFRRTLETSEIEARLTALERERP